jgi:hypothetical protein
MSFLPSLSSEAALLDVVRRFSDHGRCFRIPTSDPQIVAKLLDSEK